MELMDIISLLNENVLPSDSSMASSDRTQVLDQLEQRLHSLPQFLVPHGVMSHVSREDAIVKTAELYRLASLVYLHKAARRRPKSCPEVRTLVKSAMEILLDLTVCAAPWPMFIVACEIEDDLQRTLILEVLDTSEKVRKAGNLTWMKNIVQAVWKQDDLGTYMSVAGKPVEPYLRYGAALSAYSELPTFA